MLGWQTIQETTLKWADGILFGSKNEGVCIFWY
jgi:hypothetical protein